MPDPVTLTPDPHRASTYLWPDGLTAVLPWGDAWLAYREGTAPRLLRDNHGGPRLFPSPTLAASALGARLPAE